MLYYDRIDRSKGIDHAKSNKSREFMICHYWFFNYGFKFQDHVCNGCHDLSMFCINISDIAIISKSEAIHLLENSILEDRRYL